MQPLTESFFLFEIERVWFIFSDAVSDSADHQEIESAFWTETLFTWDDDPKMGEARDVDLL